MGWGQIPPVVREAKLNDEIRKRGLKISRLEESLGRVALVVGKDWRGRYAQDFIAEILAALATPDDPGRPGDLP
jgi:hypothetical protein